MMLLKSLLGSQHHNSPPFPQSHIQQLACTLVVASLNIPFSPSFCPLYAFIIHHVVSPRCYLTHHYQWYLARQQHHLKRESHIPQDSCGVVVGRPARYQIPWRPAGLPWVRLGAPRFLCERPSLILLSPTPRYTCRYASIMCSR